jgi:D-alanine-D-alanine ligase
MTERKLRVGVLFGGRSGEHEVSLLSAASVMQAMDRSKYEVVPIGITKQGLWLTDLHAEQLIRGEFVQTQQAKEGLAGGNVHANKRLRAGDPSATSSAAVLAKGEAVLVPPVPSESSIVPFATPRNHAAPSGIHVDVIFPVLHGTFGEDGTMQGLLELADIAYVGSGVLGSSAGMDKDVMKKLFACARLPLVKHLTVLRSEWEREPKRVEKAVDSALKYPVFVKPANLGSSVGISKAHDAGELPAAMDEAALYDRKIVIEQGVGGKRHKAREIECAVLGNDEPIASICGEIVPAKEFYDYDAKYIDAGSELLIPARLDHTQARQVQEMAIRAFQSVECSGLARVDFLMDPATGHFYLNEVNTMPGFTSISMYPKLWAATGIEYPALIDRLIELALERHADKKRNRYTKD